jgi:hypothetical protein
MWKKLLYQEQNLVGEITLTIRIIIGTITGIDRSIDGLSIKNLGVNLQKPRTWLVNGLILLEKSRENIRV